MRRLILLIFLLSLWFSAKTEPLSCSPPVVQNMCSLQELQPTSTPQSLSLPLMAFNPIHLYHGSKYLKEIDYLPHPTAPDLEVVRYYHSMHSSYNLFGLHWLLSYDIKLIKTVNSYTLQLPQGVTLELKPEQGQLHHQEQQTQWLTQHGEKWIFDQYGWLQAIHKPQRAPLIIYRHPSGRLQHRIDYIEQNQQRLQLHYNEAQPALVSHIQTPAGPLHYKYEQSPDSALYQLEQVHFPDNRRLYYHYEPLYQAQNSGLITGKSIQLHPKSPKYRIRSWVYNHAKQAIFMMTEQPNQWLRLYYPDSKSPTQTHLLSPQGHTSIDFHTQPTLSIKSVNGALCWACPPLMQQDTHQIQLPQAAISRQLTWFQGDFLGWPQLRLTYDAQQRLTSWATQNTRPTQLEYDSHGRAHRMLFANGHQQSVHYTAQGEVDHINYYAPPQTWQTRLRRPHPLQLQIEHPHEAEQLLFTPTGQVRSRFIKRRVHNTTLSQWYEWHYNEHFHYNSEEQLIRHDLPEGGHLHYVWQGPLLHSIYWQSTTGQLQLVAQRIQGGLQLSNGLLRLEYASPAFHWLAWTEPEQLWWQQLLIKNNQGLVQLHRLQQAYPNPETQHTQLSYNSRHQLSTLQTSTENHSIKWQTDGSLAHSSFFSSPPTFQRDDSGFIKKYSNQYQDYIMGYNPMQRLDVVLKADKTVQKNSHNAAGFRIYTQHYPQAQQQFFFYHNKKLVAEFSAKNDAKLPIHAPHPVSKRYIYWHDLPVALIDYQADTPAELLVIHSDHLGAAHAISNQEKQVQWQAQYDVFGKAHSIQGKLDYHLRRAGQYHDISTGWHDNLLRTYLPELGQYLEPDPLGPNPNSQLYGYARQQPLNHTDPWGLLLFAFDGTRYDESSGGVIHQLHQLSLDHSFYHAGPGQADELTWDAMVAYSANQIVQQQWQNLLHYLQTQPQSTAPIPIDIIGFSRGAALARHFANQILQSTQNGFFNTTDTYGNHIQACIQPRFMGLLDSVAQIGILGSRNHLYDFSVAPLWQWVGHAVALHEYRSLFPALLMGASDNQQEIGLVGAHGDIGGGYPPSGPEQASLSLVSLHWLLWQAQAHGLSFKSPPVPEATSAYLHDESHALAQDRTIENHPFGFVPDIGATYVQDFHPTLGRLVRQQVQAFLSFDLEASEREHNQKAKVDLKAYYRWLDQTLNWSPQ